jgi:rhodanese-related sulfurtransferase
MTKWTKNFSRADAEQLNPKDFPDTVFISITNPLYTKSPHRQTVSTGPANLKEHGKNGWGEVLRLQFWDVVSETGPYTAMTEEQGKEIAEFIEQNTDKSIFVHCEAGISRSAAVVSVLLDLGWTPYADPDISKANVHVRSLIKKHFEHLMPIGYKEPEKVSPYTFTMDEQEVRKYLSWKATHECSRRGTYHGAIGGETTFTFLPTSMGDCVGAICSCGKKINVTNFENW